MTKLVFELLEDVWSRYNRLFTHFEEIRLQFKGSQQKMTATLPSRTFTGGCACRRVRYALPTTPIYTHACHCRYCQRETGASFALNAMYEASFVQLTSGTSPEIVDTPTLSQNPQKIARCPHCKVAVWSNYGSHGGDRIRIVRVGTLDEPDFFPPEMHIFTASKQPWVTLGDDIPAVLEFYDFKEYWPKDRLERLDKVIS